MFDELPAYHKAITEHLTFYVLDAPDSADDPQEPFTVPRTAAVAYNLDSGRLAWQRGNQWHQLDLRDGQHEDLRDALEPMTAEKFWLLATTLRPTRLEQAQDMEFGVVSVAPDGILLRLGFAYTDEYQNEVEVFVPGTDPSHPASAIRHKRSLLNEAKPHELIESPTLGEFSHHAESVLWAEGSGVGREEPQEDLRVPFFTAQATALLQARFGLEPAQVDWDLVAAARRDNATCDPGEQLDRKLAHEGRQAGDHRLRADRRSFTFVGCGAHSLAGWHGLAIRHRQPAPTSPRGCTPLLATRPQATRPDRIPGWAQTSSPHSGKWRPTPSPHRRREPPLHRARVSENLAHQTGCSPAI